MANPGLEGRIGVFIYWVVVYGFSIGLGAVCEAVADVLSVFVVGWYDPNVHFDVGALPILVVVVIFVALGLSAFLNLSEKIIREPIAKATPAFAAFSLVVIFIGSHLLYGVLKHHYEMKSRVQSAKSAVQLPDKGRHLSRKRLRCSYYFGSLDARPILWRGNGQLD